MKKIIILSLAAFIAAFGTYRAFKELADAMENWDMEWEEAEEAE